ncbi:MAG: energy transducer TonB [Micropepsaceae bacterium]
MELPRRAFCRRRWSLVRDTLRHRAWMRGVRVRHLLWIAFLVWPVAAFADAPQAPVKWPLGWCEPSRVQNASPAPLPSESTSLRRVPFSMSITPFTAAVLVRLTPDYRPAIECVVDEGFETGFELSAVEALADVVFSAPVAVNTAEPGGLYLARISTYWGMTWLDMPPPMPILPRCPGFGEWFRPRWLMPDAPRPATRVPPAYPEQALSPGIEGSVVVVLDIFSNGDAIPKCIRAASPPGWFEKSALDALAQWRFQPGVERGEYGVTVRYRMED